MACKHQPFVHVSHPEQLATLSLTIEILRKNTLFIGKKLNRGRKFHDGRETYDRAWFADMLASNIFGCTDAHV